MLQYCFCFFCLEEGKFFPGLSAQKVYTFNKQSYIFETPAI